MQKFLRIAKSVKASTALASTLVNLDLVGAVNSTANTAVILRLKDAPTSTLDRVTLSITGDTPSRNAIIDAVFTASLGKSSSAVGAFILDSLPTANITISTTID